MYVPLNQKKSEKEISEELEKTLKSYELVDSSVFADAAFDKQICIFQFGDKQEKSFSEFLYLNFLNQKLAKSIIEKINLANKENCGSKLIQYKDFDNYSLKCIMSHKRGHFNSNTHKQNWDWTTYMDEEKMSNFNLKKTDLPSPNFGAIPFNSEKECKNFVKYLNSDIIQFVTFFYKKSLSQISNLKFVPYLDFTKDCNDNELKKEFKLTDEEYNYIIEEMKNFGWKTRK